MYCVFPTLSKVRNFGHDGSGEHGGSIINSVYANQKIDDKHHFEFSSLPIAEDNKMNEVLNEHFKLTWKGRIKTFLLMARILPKLIFSKK